jgi:hypothetical protein
VKGGGFAAAALLLAIGGGLASAQTRPRLEVTLPPPSALAKDGPTIRAVGVVTDTAMLVLVRSGFPMRLHYRLELWAARRLFDNLLAAAEWDVVVRYDALNEQYRVFRIDSTRAGGARQRTLGVFSSVTDAAAEVERPMRVALAGSPTAGRQYFRAVLDVATLSNNDLDEIDRWLRGELSPAVRGERNPGTAIGRGVRRVLVRVLGEERHLESRTPSFRVGSP